MSYSLTSGFMKAVGAYLLPLPLSFKNPLRSFIQKASFAVVAQQALHSGLGLLMYPTIEEKFAELGIESSVVEKMDLPAWGFVRPAPQDRNIIDHIYAMTDVPTIFGVINGLQRSFGYSHGMALPYPVCDISLVQAENTAISWPSVVTNVSRDNLLIIVSDEDATAMILAHETGHCDLAIHSFMAMNNVWDAIVHDELDTLLEKQFLQAELYSDRVALRFSTFINDAGRSKAMRDFLTNTRHANDYHIWDNGSGFAYDFGLVLDSQINGKPIPDFNDIIESRKELADYVLAHASFVNRTALIPALIESVEGFLQDQTADKNPFSIQRAELYLKAMSYMAPNMMVEQSPMNMAQASMNPN